MATEAVGLRLIGHADLGGRGDGCQIMRRADVLYVAHMGRAGMSVLDVRDPRRPTLLHQTERPPGAHSHKLQLAGDLLVQNVERQGAGEPARTGVVIYDVSQPRAPREVGFFPVGGPGVHRMWFVDGRYVHMAAGAPGYSDQFYMVADLERPDRPAEVGRWWLPGMHVAGGEARSSRPGERFACHHPIVHGARAYVGWWDAGFVILDVQNLAQPRLVSHLDWSPPFGGATHTVLPLRGGRLAVVTDEALADNCQEGDKRAWVVDLREETRPVPIATLPEPGPGFCARGGRYGPHNLHENRPGTFVSDERIYLTYFNAGVRVYDLADPFRPREVASFVPEPPPGQATPQWNDLLVTADGLIFVTDRLNGGLYVLEHA
ncbi:MAG: LVIVD repeat-containing protein [Candidatus Rokuibacteriota bacterium]